MVLDEDNLQRASCHRHCRLLSDAPCTVQVLRDVFNYRPKLTKEQFLSTGFAERKVLMTRDVLLFCQAKNAELVAHDSSTHTRKRYSHYIIKCCHWYVMELV